MLRASSHSWARGWREADVAALVGYAGVRFIVCLLACIVPTRLALLIEPTEALRVE
jgi:ABC-type lipoprotein release transport system permease subunit